MSIEAALHDAFANSNISSLVNTNGRTIGTTSTMEQ